MDKEIVTTGLTWTYFIVTAAVILINMVLGILITTSKVKPTRVLGISIILSTAAWGIRFAFYLFQMSASELQIYNSQTWVNLAIILIGIADIVLLCRYMHKNYGKRKIYIPVLILRLVPQTLGTFLIILVVNGLHLFKRDGGIHITLMTSVVALATSVAINIIIIRVFYGNRMREKVVPGYWKCHVVTFFWTVITSLFNIYEFHIILYGQDHRDAPIVEMWRTNGENISRLVSIIGALIALIMPVYIYMKVNRVSHYGVTDKEEPAYESAGALPETEE